MKNHDSGNIPYYVQVAETLRRRIHLRYYPEGSLLPNSDVLEKEFDVSEITIRKALATLTEEGLLHRKRGLGTVVASYPRDIVTLELSGSSGRLVHFLDKLPPDLKVLEHGVIPCPHPVAEVLGVEPAAPVWFMKKLRRYDATPLCFYIHYCLPAHGAKISPEEAEKDNFVNVFRKATGERIVTLEQRLEAACADAELSTWLQVRFGAPLLFLEHIFLSPEEKATLLTHIWFRGDRCSVKGRTSL